MVVDDDREIRNEALNKILVYRKNQKADEKPRKVRTFRVPKLNFDAKNYVNLIDWKECSEPPALSLISDEELERLVLTNPEELKELLRIPCHTQAVERNVKIVTKASK